LSREERSMSVIDNGRADVVISRVSLACELQRDCAGVENVPAIVEIVPTDRSCGPE
jgi:hypothetical protein